MAKKQQTQKTGALTKKVRRRAKEALVEKKAAASKKGTEKIPFASTLTPGYLVAFRTSITGNVDYSKLIIESEHRVKGGANRAKWETTRTIEDPKEHAAAKTARGQACAAIRRVCIQSAFGLLCPEKKASELTAAIAEARRYADAFNKKAKITRLFVDALPGRVAQDDVQAVRAITSEVTELLAAMEKGVANVDAEAVRAAAARVKGLGEMLAPDAAEKVKAAVEVARQAARQIVKAGNKAAQEIDLEVIKQIAAARTSFLDFDAAVEIGDVGADARALDFEMPSFVPEGQLIPDTIGTPREIELENGGN
jgi:hypothetical protein